MIYKFSPVPEHEQPYCGPGPIYLNLNRVLFAQPGLVHPDVMVLTLNFRCEGAFREPIFVNVLTEEYEKAAQIFNARNG